MSWNFSFQDITCTLASSYYCPVMIEESLYNAFLCLVILQDHVIGQNWLWRVI